MERDLSLIRELLLRIEGTTSRQDRPDFNIDGCSEIDIDYNLDLAIHAGLVNGRGSWAADIHMYNVTIHGLTWAGHDFLDSVRKPSVWNETQEKAEKAGHKIANMTLEVVQALATSVIKGQLGL